MIKRALSKGIDASYVLMDSWFTQPPLIKNIVNQGIDVIGMVKATNQRYLLNNKRVSLKELYRLAASIAHHKSILRSIHTTMANGVDVKVVFVRNRNKKKGMVGDIEYRFHLNRTGNYTECAGILKSSLKQPSPF